MPKINLLPWREAQRKQRRQEFMYSIGAAVATAALVTLLGRWQMSSAIASQQERNDYLEGEISELDKRITEILGLENQKTRLIARMEIIETLQRSRPEIVHVFDELVNTLPDGVNLSFVKQNGERIELRGATQSSTRVSALMRNIDQSQWLADPALQVVETKGKTAGSGASFTMFASQRRQTPVGEDGEVQEAGDERPRKPQKVASR
jgi:type IV pilus assembly protein PilN